MLQRFLFFFVGGLLLTAACSPEKEKKVDLYKAIPPNSVMVLETKNLLESLQDISETNVYREVDSLKPILSSSVDMQTVVDIFSNDSLTTLLNNKQFLMSLAPSGARKYNVLFATQLPSTWEKDVLKKISRQYAVNPYQYSEVTIYKIQANRQFHIAFAKGIVVGSSNQNLLEEAVRQLLSEYSLLDNDVFLKLRNTANKKEQANIYLNIKELPGYFKELFPNGNTAFLKQFGAWAELDLDVLNRELVMSGVTLGEGDNKTFMHAFAEAEAQESDAAKIIPTGFNYSCSYTFNNAETWIRKATELNLLKTSSQNLKAWETKLESEYPTVAREALINWIDNEVGIIMLPGGAKIGFAKHRDKDLAIKALEKVANPAFIEGHRGSILKQLGINKPYYGYFGNLFKGLNKAFYFEHKGYILLSSDLSVLRTLIDDYLAEKTLANEERFDAFSSMLQSEAHIHCLATGAGFIKTLGKALPENQREDFAKETLSMDNFSGGAIQLTYKDNAAYTNLYVKHQPAAEERVKRVWSTPLEAPAISAPQFVLNHNNKKYEVLVQDSNYKLYLIDRAGKILWTKLLDGPMQGGSTQIDMFKNKKLQYALNTLNKVYVIDRLGRDVENWPLDLKKPATAPMAVFDYDNNRKYRFLVPCGQELLNLNIQAKAVNGWEFKPSEEAIVFQPQLLKIGSKEVVLTYDDGGILRFLYRNGKDRYESQSIPELKSKFHYTEGKTLDEAQLTSLKENGKIAYIAIGGAHESLFLDADKPADFYTYFENHNVFTHNNVLVNKEAEQPWSVNFEDDISATPKVMIFGGDFYTAAFSQSAEEIRLINKEGTVIEGFPVYAQGPFDMGSLSQNSVINIVTTTKDGAVICYGVN